MIIAVDFDGTCLTHSFPELGDDIGAVPVLKKLVEAKHQLILFTMRSDSQEAQDINGYTLHSGDFLTQAVKWFMDNGIPLYGIQKNPTQDSWTSSPKCYAHLYIDDAALGCPLIYPKDERPYVDWKSVEMILQIKGII